MCTELLNMKNNKMTSFHKITYFTRALSINLYEMKEAIYNERKKSPANNNILNNNTTYFIYPA